jgi:diacylglycerol O-acyltransferase
MSLTHAIERVSADDMMSLVPPGDALPLHVGAVLMLDARGGLPPARLQEMLARRLPAVPRLRQKLVRVPLGCGRPVWMDDPTFTITHHFSVVSCKEPHTIDTVLGIAADRIATPLPSDRPLWAATLVTGVDNDQAALIIVIHHVLADGIAALTVLADLVDGAAETVDPQFPRPGPSRTRLALDAGTRRLRSMMRVPAAAGRLAAAVVELAPTVRTPATPCSLNRPTGSVRRFVVAQSDLRAIHTVARRNGATVNDVVLATITASLHLLLAARGEHVPAFVVSVPFSSRRETDADDLGNRSGAVPLLLPATGTFEQRLTEITRITRAAKRSERGASTAVLGPAFRFLARIGLYQWFIDHQHRVHTFASNVHGPETRLHLLGCPVTDIVPLGLATGSVTVSFAILSYAGNLTIAINADPQACPDLVHLRDIVVRELALIA